MANSTQEQWQKAVYEAVDCERNQKFYVKVFFGWEAFLSRCSSGKKLRKCFFNQFCFDVSHINRRQAISENRDSVWKENQSRMRAAKLNS